MSAARVCQSCGAIQTPDAPHFDLRDADVDAFGSLRLGPVTVHDWGSDPDLTWPYPGTPWRFYGFWPGRGGGWSPSGYRTAEEACRAAWFNITDPTRVEVER